jgi:hypothetical protein
MRVDKARQNQSTVVVVDHSPRRRPSKNVARLADFSDSAGFESQRAVFEITIRRCADAARRIFE